MSSTILGGAPWRVLTQTWATFRLADAADILVVSVLAYAAILWFRQTRSRFVVSGVAALVALYFAAQLFDMYLTLELFRLVISVALIALVVIFQEELRRVFERIVSARPFRAGAVEGRDELVETVTRAVATMANTKTGALIVFKGTAPLERHLTGGISLDAKPSEPILYSIFDPHSAGHDGAVVIDRGRITKFAAHLPLSQSPGAAHLGTRHCAAIGLSERSDAFIIVVSEERGTISVPHAGSLEVVTAGELGSRLQHFLEHSFPKKRRSFWKRVFTERLGAKALAFVLAVVAWLVVAREQSELVARTFTVPIQYSDVRPNIIPEGAHPAQVRVTLQGSARQFRTIDPGSLSISIDVNKLGPGWHSIELSPSDVSRPRDIAVKRISPTHVNVHIQVAGEGASPKAQ